MADVTLTYKGATIAELSDSGSKTLRTAGKYCEADIGVAYVKPGGGSGVLSGSITPAERTLELSFNVGNATVNHVLIIPKSETPLKSGGKTACGLLYNADAFWPYIVLKSNNAGASLLTPSTDTGGVSLDTLVRKNGSVLTIKTPSVNFGMFETIEYAWYVW